MKEASSLSRAEELALSLKGKALASQFNVLLKTAKLYSRENSAFQIHLQQTHDLMIRCIHDIGELTLKLQSHHLFFCGVRIRFGVEGFVVSSYLKEIFSKVGISGLWVHSHATKSDLEKTAILLSLWGLAAQEFHEIESRFEFEGIQGIVPLPLDDESLETPDEERQKREFAQKTFFNAIDSLKSASTFARSSKSLDLIRTKRVVHTLVDQIIADESYLLELTALKSHDEYTFVHSTNVCIYAICLGNRLDLTKTELAALGFAALFHDIGKMQLPAEILNKPADFNEKEWELMRKHPVYGILAIARTMPFDEKSCRAMLVAFEHHYNLDGSGYPEIRIRRALNLASKIVAICDVFDALTSGRSYRRAPLSPERVIEQMSIQAGMKFDQNLLKTFIQVVSIFPPGTLLLLDDDHLALVSGRNDDNLLMPKAILIGKPEKLFDQGERINLADRDPQTGKYLRNIVRTLDPLKLNINLSRFILETG